MINLEKLNLDLRRTLPDLMCETDCKDASFVVSLHPDSRKFARFKWTGNLYQFLSMPLLWTQSSPKDIYSVDENTNFSYEKIE